MDFNDLNGYLPEFTFHLMISSIILVGAFLVDDIKELKASSRLLIQILLSLYIIYITDISLNNLGDLFGFGKIYLGIFSIPFTVFCIVGIMNAFNMLDGLNGLCAGMTLQTLLVIFLITTLHTPAYGFLIPIGAIIGFMLYNLGLIGKKRRVFLGDNGSNLMGFLAGWIAIYVSQGENAIIEPVTALWFVFIPLIDCVTVISSRIINGVMPFRPGRDHLHHRLLDRGLNSNQILQIYIVFSIILSSIGYAIQTAFPNAIYLSFYIFLIFTLMYYVGIKLYLKNVQYI
jgi:UDP-GlcNAc:undecaprenyl-phosphate GlcNAc-1-phosphate transferase